MPTMLYAAPMSETPDDWARRLLRPIPDPPVMPAPDGTPVPLDPPVWCWRSDQPPSEVDLILLWTGACICVAARGLGVVGGVAMRLADRWLVYGEPAPLTWGPLWRWMPLPPPPAQRG